MTAAPPIEALKAIAHPVRFRILETLRDGERNVGEIEEASKIAQPALSQQLAILRNAGLVDTRKQAKLVFYCLASDVLNDLSLSIAAFVDRADETTPARKSPAPGAANFARLS